MKGFSPGVAELGQYVLCVHPGVGCLADDCTVAAPGVAVQFFACLDNAGAEGVEVDVADEGKQIVVFVAEDGFIAIFKKVAGAFVAAVIILGIPGKEFSHDAGDALFAALKEDMNVVAHKRPCVNRALPFRYRVAQTLYEQGPILIVVKYIGFVDAPHHDVVQRSGDVESGLSRHG